MKTFTIHFTAALFVFLLTLLLPSFWNFDPLDKVCTWFMIQLPAAYILDYNFHSQWQPHVPIDWNDKWFA